MIAPVVVVADEGVKGGEKVYHCDGGIVYHRHDEKGLNWEAGGVRSGAGVPSSGVSQESSGSSEIGEAAFPRLCRRRYVKGGEKVYRCGGARVAHWHDEKEPNGKRAGLGQEQGFPVLE